MTNTVDLASEQEYKIDLAKFTIRRIARKAFDLVVEAQMQTFKVNGTVSTINSVLDQKQQEFLAMAAEEDQQAKEFAIQSKQLQVQVSNLFDDATEDLDEMIRQDYEFKEMIADARQGESEVLASYDDA